MAHTVIMDIITIITCHIADQELRMVRLEENTSARCVHRWERYLAPKPIFSSIHKFTCGKPNHINVRSATNHLPTPATCRNIREFILASNRTNAKFVNENSPSCHTSSNIFARIQVISPTNVDIQAAPRPFRNYQIYSRTPDVIKRINHTSATHATNASLMRPRCWSTYPNIKNRSTSKRTSVNIVGNLTRRKHIWQSTCKNIRIEKSLEHRLDKWEEQMVHLDKPTDRQTAIMVSHQGVETHCLLSAPLLVHRQYLKA
jgi:hypothetical protein